MINLSERENQIIRLITQGFDNKTIGIKLNISIHTVKVHITSIMHKMNARNRTEIAFLAGKYKIVE